MRYAYALLLAAAGIGFGLAILFCYWAFNAGNVYESIFWFISFGVIVTQTLNLILSLSRKMRSDR